MRKEDVIHLKNAIKELQLAFKSEDSSYMRDSIYDIHLTLRGLYYEWASLYGLIIEEDINA